METWEKVTTRSQVSVYRNTDPMVTIAAIDLKHNQDGRHTHFDEKNKIEKITLSSDCTCWLSGKRSLPLGYLF